MGEDRNRVVVIGVLLVLAAMGGIGAGLADRSPTVSPPPSPGSTSRTTSAIDVHVAGWVVSPGVVTVSDGAIVADAIEAAGGLRVGARVDTLNLAAQVTAGDQIVVPGPESAGAQVEAGGGLLPLNQATAAELEALPGVGPVLAERIVAYRQDSGRFETVEDLLDVPGIGESKLAAIRDLVRP